MGHTLRAFLRRPAADRRLLLHALSLYLAIVALLRVVAHGRLTRWLDALYPATSHQPPATDPVAATSHQPPATNTVEADRVAWAVRTVAAKARISDACLAEALTALCLLRSGGHAADLRIGVTRDGAATAIAAHAWLEHAGRIIVGRAAAPAYHTLLPPGAMRGER